MSLELRLARPDDAAAMLEIYAPLVRDTTISFEYEPPAVADFAARIAGVLATRPWLVATADGLLVGYAYASSYRSREAYRWTTEVSVYVRAGWQRRGIGRRLYEVLLRSLRWQGFHAALGIITLPNPVSLAFHASLGFREAGVFPRVGFKHGAWCDTAWWILELGEGGAPRPLRTLGHLLASDEWPHVLDGG